MPNQTVRSTDWRYVTVGDVVTLQRGFDITKAAQTEGPYPVISSSGPTSTHAAFKVEGPGVVIGRKGVLGGVYYSEAPFWPHDTTLWVKDFHGNDPKFVYYWLTTLGLGRYDVGAANPTLNRNHAHLLSTVIPARTTQRKIAEILSTYDDLIENNNRRISFLEEMAQRIYREWFVDFRYPGHEGVPLVDSGFGPIPEAWAWRELQELATESRIGIDPASVDPDTPYIGLEHMPERSIAIADWGSASEAGSRKYRFEAGQILFGKIRPYFHKVAVPPVSGICSTDAIVISSRTDECWGLVLAVVSSDAFVEAAVQTSQGTKMPRANWNVLERYHVAVPPKGLRDAFNRHMTDTVALIHRLVRADRSLRASRDVLLPRLVSGEIDVTDLDIDVSELTA